MKSLQRLMADASFLVAAGITEPTILIFGFECSFFNKLKRFV